MKTRCTLAALALVAACGTPTTTPTPREPALRVTGHITYITLDNVPRSLADMVADQITGPAYFLVSNGQFCAVTAEEFVAAIDEQPYVCRWRFPRGR